MAVILLTSSLDNELRRFYLSNSSYIFVFLKETFFRRVESCLEYGWWFLGVYKLGNL